MKLDEKLDQHEYATLLKFPVYISLLAANSDGVLDEAEKKEAIQLTHIKAYASDPLLADFYTDVEKTFVQDIERLDAELPKDRVEREHTINAALQKLEAVLDKLDAGFTELIYKSMRSYIDHVSKAHQNVLTSFIIPFNIKGLTDNN